jgi:hypothetical protein
MEAGIKLWTVSCSLIAPRLSFLAQSSHLLCTWWSRSIPTRFASVEENMYSVWLKVDWIMWETEFKWYSHFKCKLYQVYLNEEAQIYRSVMHWDRHLKERQQSGPPHGMVSQDSVRWIYEMFQRIPLQVSSPSTFGIRPALLSCAWYFCTRD